MILTAVLMYAGLALSTVGVLFVDTMWWWTLPAVILGAALMLGSAISGELHIAANRAKGEAREQEQTSRRWEDAA